MLLSGCGSDSSSGPEFTFSNEDLPALFAAPTQAERDSVLADWAARDTSPQDVRVILRDTVAVGIDTVEIRVLSHSVAGNLHYGALVVSTDALANPRHVLLYTHFSDIGINVESTIFATGAIAGVRAGQFALVLPSYRGKQLTYGNQAWTSEGDVSLWDGEVDDALALLHVAWEQPGVDRSQTAAIGFSGGGTIALLSAVREPGIHRVVDFFAPTDFFGTWAQGLLTDVLEGNAPGPRSIQELDRSLITPLQRGELSLADMRMELLRRSTLHFAERLPMTLAHHGTSDGTVDVEQTRALEAAAPSIEAWYYTGAGHDPFALQGSLVRTAEFLLR